MLCDQGWTLQGKTRHHCSIHQTRHRRAPHCPPLLIHSGAAQRSTFPSWTSQWRTPRLMRTRVSGFALPRHLGCHNLWIFKALVSQPAIRLPRMLTHTFVYHMRSYEVSRPPLLSLTAMERRCLPQTVVAVRPQRVRHLAPQAPISTLLERYPQK
jgi:hypothetical protein